MKKNLFTFLCMATVCWPVQAQTTDRIHYTGMELSNPAYHDGQLMPVVGVHNIQVMRANREHPDASNGNGWTYNHQPMLAYWNGRFYMQYLADPADEHVPPSQTFITTSQDGYHWTDPVVAFPDYRMAVRTGKRREFPTPETPADQEYDLPDAGGQEPLAVFRLTGVKSENLEP